MRAGHNWFQSLGLRFLLIEELYVSQLFIGLFQYTEAYIKFLARVIANRKVIKSKVDEQIQRQKKGSVVLFLAPALRKV